MKTVKDKQILMAAVASVPAAFLVVYAFAVLTCAAATTDAEPVSSGRQHTWWAGPYYFDRRHAAKLKEIAEGPKEYDFVFIGDSITHSWEGWSDPIDLEAVDKAYGKGMLKFQNGPGRKVWDEMKKEFRLLNLGCAGDTTQNVLWRLDHGELDGYRTRGVALMIGTNNSEPAGEIADGIKAIVRKILEKQPEAKVVLMPIFPSEHSPSAPRRVPPCSEPPVGLTRLHKGEDFRLNQQGLRPL